MPPKFKRGSAEDRDRVHLLGLYSSDEEEEEIFLNMTPNGPHQSSRVNHQPVRTEHGNEKIKQVQRQVQGVMGVMKDNISKVLERGEKLTDLQDKSEELVGSATTFRVTSRRMARKAWWQQFRIKLFIVALVLILVSVIIIVIVLRSRPSS
ncbi:Vesicle-associated membrane protein 4 [Geodia barretti]|uniref:Vesicle-associated membrane protein 4 n=3 Tax=Geodia barretti TaxID=519541 RepID=A0AA35RG13_GEOBA|nr:Vesicle-associated membrane protein 4 [Geodia barretti]